MEWARPLQAMFLRVQAKTSCTDKDLQIADLGSKLKCQRLPAKTLQPPVWWARPASTAILTRAWTLLWTTWTVEWQEVLVLSSAVSTLKWHITKVQTLALETSQGSHSSAYLATHLCLHRWMPFPRHSIQVAMGVCNKTLAILHRWWIKTLETKTWRLMGLCAIQMEILGNLCNARAWL